MKIKLTFCSIVLSLFVSACGPSMRITPGQIPPTTPPPADLKAAAESYVSAHMSQQNYKEIKRGPEVVRVTKVVERLSTAAGYPPRTFPVHVVDAGEEVNAAAFNGASIVVYEELLRRVPEDTGLATVLGHEIGHIVLKHYTDEEEEQRRAQTVSVGSSLLGSIASIATSAAGYGGAADLAGSATESASGMIGYGAYVGSFNRTQEYEADHVGLLIMSKAGYDPETALNFWSSADQIFGSSTSSASAFFSTHPASRDRLKALQDAMPYAKALYAPGSGASTTAVKKKKQ